MILTCKNCKHFNDFGDVIDEGQEPCWSCLRARGDYLPNHELIEKKKTNADRIRSMSDEELADFIGHKPTIEWCPADKDCTWDDDCKDCVLVWLRKEA